MGRKQKEMEAIAAKVNRGRIRKVTITEIENERELNCKEDTENMKDKNITEKTTDEIFSTLEKAVIDWKASLENIVAEGLKKIKKTTKEKKMTMKYLPGDGIPAGYIKIQTAKDLIIKEWKEEFNNILHETHQSLNNMGDDLSEQVTPKTEEVNIKNKAEEYETDSFIDMKNLMRDLETVYQQYNRPLISFNKVPIYNIHDSGIRYAIQNVRSTPWWNSMCTLGQIKDFQMEDKRILPNQDIMKKFEQKTRLMKNRHMKQIRRGKKSLKGSKERNDVVTGRRFVLREFIDKGEKHFIVVKKDTPNPSAVIEAEEIFADWKTNFAQIKIPTSHKPRVRKLSHRQLRKGLIKETKMEEENMMGPLTYSQMLKKNLKVTQELPSIEEIFESWIVMIQDLEEQSNAVAKVPLKTQLEDVEFFRVWRHNFKVKDTRLEDVEILNTTTCIPSLANFECGRPTLVVMERKLQPNTTMTRKYNAHKTVGDKKGFKKESPTCIKGKKITGDTDTDIKAKTNIQVISYVDRKVTEPSPQKPKMPEHPPANVSIPLPDLLTDKGVEKTERNELKNKLVIKNKPENSKMPTKASRRIQPEDIFSEWMFNLATVEVKMKPTPTIEEENMPRSNSGSPKSNKKEVKKQKRDEDIEDDMTDMKENRRHDFAKNVIIKHKKRSEASRLSTGKRTK